MYMDLPPPKNPVKAFPPASAACGVKRDDDAKEPEQRDSDVPREVHGIGLPEWARKPRCQLVLEERKDDVVMARIPLHELPAYVIGREMGSVDMPLLHPTISRKHAMIVHGTPPEIPVAQRALGVTLIDLKSASGTFLRGGLHGRKRQLAPGAHLVLRDEMVIQFGGSSRSYRVTGTSEAAVGAPSARLTVGAGGVDLVQVALAQDEGKAELAYPKELHPAVRAKLAASDRSRTPLDPFRTSNILNEHSDMAPQAATLNEHFRGGSILGKRTSETAFSGQASMGQLAQQRMRERTRLLQRTQGHVIEGSERLGIEQVVVEPSVGPMAQVAVAVQAQGEHKRLALIRQHLMEAEAAEEAAEEDQHRLERQADDKAIKAEAQPPSSAPAAGGVGMAGLPSVCLEAAAAQSEQQQQAKQREGPPQVKQEQQQQSDYHRRL